MSGAGRSPRLEEARAVLATRLPKRRPDGRPPALLGAGVSLEEQRERGRAYLEALADGGWGTPSWPVEAGGAGLDRDELLELERLHADYERPDLYLFAIGLGMAGPMIARHGTPDQRARHLDAIRTGREIWCQLFSEPQAGSDLASLRTRARRDGDGWLISGHKTWVSRASLADYGLLLARTDPDARRHEGLTVFILPMDAAGVTVAPIRQMNGDDHFCEVFLEDVRLDDSHVLGAVGEGWRVAMSTLAAERGVAADAGVPPQAVLALLREHGGADDPLTRDAAGRAIVTLALPAICRREGFDDGAKVLAAEGARQLAALARELRGPAAALDDGPWAMLELTAPSLSIRGGTDEIQLNVIAERVLGLPREPRGESADGRRPRA